MNPYALLVSYPFVRLRCGIGWALLRQLDHARLTPLRDPYEAMISISVWALRMIASRRKWHHRVSTPQDSISIARLLMNPL
jgi:hypothetical protein